MKKTLTKTMIALFIGLTFISCKQNKEEIIKKAKDAFVGDCDKAARANPGAGNIDFVPYCSCAWNKLMTDKKFEEMIVNGDDKSPEAMEYSNKKIEDPDFQKELEACKDEIKLR